MPEFNLEADIQFHVSLVLRRQVTSKGICLTSAQQFLTSDNHHPLLKLISSGKWPVIYKLMSHLNPSRNQRLMLILGIDVTEICPYDLQHEDRLHIENKMYPVELVDNSV